LNDPTPSSAEESRIQDYLAGRLDAAAAERFEQRMFEDDALAAEVETALEIRAATPAQAAARRLSRPPRRVWYALAAAAGAAVLAVGVVWLQQPPPAPVFRGIEQRMGLEVEVDGGALRARWQPVAAAARYELQVLASDGRVLRSLEAEGTAATVDLGAPAEGPSAAAFVEVSALDDVGQTLQRSERLALPDR
jgi:anti-sigma factor RsiW